jgi:uncharacterized protein YndB with AHSA1/START domain
VDTLIAKATVQVHAPLSKVWEALVSPALIKQYMFGATVTSTWKPGGDITWRGEFHGKPYEDKGQILGVEPQHLLRYSHASGSAPSQRHIVTIELNAHDSVVDVSLSQDNNRDENARRSSEQNWTVMLEGLKRVVES